MEQPLPTTPAPDPGGPPGPTDWSQVPAPGGGPRPSFGVGAIVSGTFRIWWRDLPAYAFLAILAAVPAAWATYNVYSRHPELVRPDPSANPFEVLGGIYVGFGAYWFVAFVLLAIEAGAVIHAAVRRLHGEKPRLGEMLSVGLQRSFAMFAMLVVVLLATVATACTLFVVPILLACGWAAAAPAVTVERAGPIRALGRSWELTRGHRWKILGGGVLVYLAYAAVVVSLQLVLTGGAFSVSLAATPEEIQALALPMALHQIASGIFGTPLFLASAVIHHQLRLAKEGGDPVHLAHVFE